MTTPSPADAALRQSVHQLTDAGVIPRIAADLARSRASVQAALRDTVLAEIPGFLASGNPDLLPQFERHAAAHVEEIMRLFGGGEPGTFEFVRTHARRRAEQRFPLEATLHAYRCGLKVVSRWLRDAAVATGRRGADKRVAAVADFAIEYTNAISAIATAEYVAHTRRLAEAESDRRVELLTILLSGYDESDGRVARLLKESGHLEQRRCYCVVVARAVNASEMESLSRAQRMATAVGEALAGTSVRALVGIRNNLVTAVLSDRRRLSGWTPAQANLAHRVLPRLQLLGPAALVGVSADHPATAFVPKALHEAAIALDFASVTRRVVLFADLPIRDLLVHNGTDYVRAAPPAWVSALTAADAAAAGALVATLRALADADLNVQQAARQLGRHPNTVYARLERIKADTGLDGRRYRDLTELLLAADCWRR